MAGIAGCSCRCSPFGVLPDGRKVVLYTLTNKNNMTITVSDFGATLVSIVVPDKLGKTGDIALGFDAVDGYIAPNNPFIGATIGRFGNRIARGTFTLNGTQYTLATNNGPNHLHGGPGGFDKVLWNVVSANEQKKEIVLHYNSPDGEEGYPGNCMIMVRYRLTDNNEIVIDYTAVSDADTVINLTNHTYFNLNGKGTINDHILKMSAAYFTPVDATQIPTGEIRSVHETPFDFLAPHTLGERIDLQSDEQIRYGSGYDHNFVVSAAPTMKPVAKVFCKESGRLLEVTSTEPGVQLYTGNFLDGSLIGKNGVAYSRRSGFCLETQHYPDSPNKSIFPSTILKAQEVFKSCTVYRVSVAQSI